MSKEQKTASISDVILAILLIPCGIIFNGWVISIIWNWYADSFGAPEIGVAAAIGLSCIIGMFRDRSSATKPISGKSTGEIFGKMIGGVFGVPLLFLLLAWIASFWLGGGV